MLEVYGYEVDGRTYRLECASYEAKLLSRVADSDVGVVFAPHDKSVVKTTSRTKLLVAAGQLLSSLDGQIELRQYRYGLTTHGVPGGKEYRGSVSFGCRLDGRLAIAEAGPGYCHIHAVETMPYGKPGKQLADLRNMEPLTVDDGIVLIPTRHRHPITVHVAIRNLVEFLRERNGRIVKQGYHGAVEAQE